MVHERTIGRTPLGATPALAVTLAALVLLPACALPDGEAADEGPMATPTEEEGGPLPSAVATVWPASNSEVRGVVRFEATGQGGIRVASSFTGLEKGPHAYHVHVHGDCSAPDASSAGSHFDLRASALEASEVTRILGNLGEVVAGDAGLAEHQALLPDASLSGPRGIVGRAVVIHARGNDTASPPDGDSGGRIGCGVIGIADAG